LNNQLKAELGLAGKTVYAYMPTWRGTSNHDINTASYESKVKEIFKVIDNKLSDDQVFFVNFHPESYIVSLQEIVLNIVH